MFAYKRLAKKKMMFISLLDPFEINCLPFVFPLMISFLRIDLTFLKLLLE